jgi:hypothetical protein
MSVTLQGNFIPTGMCRDISSRLGSLLFARLHKSASPSRTLFNAVGRSCVYGDNRDLSGPFGVDEEHAVQ